MAALKYSRSGCSIDVAVVVIGTVLTVRKCLLDLSVILFVGVA